MSSFYKSNSIGQQANLIQRIRNLVDKTYAKNFQVL